MGPLKRARRWKRTPDLDLDFRWRQLDGSRFGYAERQRLCAEFEEGVFGRVPGGKELLLRRRLD